MRSQRRTKKVRGVFEKKLGSGIWWIQFFDADGDVARRLGAAPMPSISIGSERPKC